MSDKGSAEDFAGACGIMLLSFPIFLVIHAWVIQYGWNSLMVPIFDLKMLNAYQAYALSGVVTLFVGSDQASGKEYEGLDIWSICFKYLGRAAARPLIFTVFIWATVLISGDKLVQ